MIEIGLIFLGWLLGLIGSSIRDEVGERRKFSAIKKALGSELDEIRLLMVFSAWKISAHRETIDKEFLDWYCAHVDAYKGIQIKDPHRKIINKLKEMPADQIPIVVAARKESNVVPGFKTYPTVILTRAFRYLHLFKEVDQRRILELSTKIHLFESLVKDVTKFMEMSFAHDLSPTNREAIVANQEDCIRLMSPITKRIVSLIDELSFVQ